MIEDFYRIGICFEWQHSLDKYGTQKEMEYFFLFPQLDLNFTSITIKKNVPLIDHLIEILGQIFGFFQKKISQ